MPNNRKPAGPRGLCAYFVEVQDRDNSVFAFDEAVFLVKKCIIDKIFSCSPDLIAVCRSDAPKPKFVEANWIAVQEGTKALSEKRSSDSGAGNPLVGLKTVLDAVKKQAEEDTYKDKKLWYFANLSSYAIDEKEVIEVAELARINDIFISIVIPTKVDMTELQGQNSKVLKNVFKTPEYDEIACVTNLENARKEILNTQTKKPVRPNPWNVLFEVTPKVKIHVAGYVCTSMNRIEGITRVFLKKVPDVASANTSRDITSGQNVDQTSSGTVIEEAKTHTEKEVLRKENDGTAVDEDNEGKAYNYGGKIVPFNKLEKYDAYKTGDKCLKLLAFCPKENIKPAFLAGEGTTIFYPRKIDAASELKFMALMKAMINTGRVAIVRRVYSKDTRVQLGCLVPDADRKCLVLTEICYADDVWIRHFPNLIKPEDIVNEEGDGELNEKESLIDELIKSKSIESFSPADGPSDPAIKTFRETVTKKLTEDSDAAYRQVDNIEIYFENLCRVHEALSEKLNQCFHLKDNSVKERLAGKDVFRERSIDESGLEAAGKKPKLEDGSSMGEIKNVDGNEPEEYDDLLDEL